MAREYKDSGIEWIGQIPKEWEVVTTKRLFNIVAGATPKTDNNELWDGDISWVTPADYKTEDKYVSKGRRNLSKKGMNSCATYLLPMNSIVFSKRAPIGLVAITANSLCTNQGCLGCLHNKSLNTCYYYYVMSAFTEQYELLGTGTTFKEISATKFASFPLLSPPLPEQQKIADYLDKVCGEADEMIALQEKMIQELKAYKQSVITEAVTKGLNPNIPMKDSGIDWIGEIPEHWNQHQFRRLFEIKKNIAGKLGYDVLSVTQGGIRVKDLTKNEGQIAQDYSKYQLVDIDDFVMNHMDLLTGYVDCANQYGVTSPDYRVFRAIDKNLVALSYYLRIFQTCYKERIFYHLGQGVSGMGRWRLPAEQLKLFVLPMPPLSEQQQIASYLDTKCSDIDSLIAVKQQKIEELKEYKKSVIYEYVTGKKEVV